MLTRENIYKEILESIIYSADFEHLKRIETIANKYIEYSKENGNLSDKEKRLQAYKILELVNYSQLIKTINTENGKKEDKKVIEPSKEDGENIKNKKGGKG